MKDCGYVDRLRKGTSLLLLSSVIRAAVRNQGDAWGTASAKLRRREEGGMRAKEAR